MWRDWTVGGGSRATSLAPRPVGPAAPSSLGLWPGAHAAVPGCPSGPSSSGSGPWHTYSYWLMGLVSRISQIIKSSAPSRKGVPAGSKTCHHPCHLPSSHCLSDRSPLCPLVSPNPRAESRSRAASTPQASEWSPLGACRAPVPTPCKGQQPVLPGVPELLSGAPGLEGTLLVRVLVRRLLDDLQFSLAVWSLRLVACACAICQPVCQRSGLGGALCGEPCFAVGAVCGRRASSWQQTGHRPFQVEDMSFLQGVHGPDMWSVSVREP